MADTKISGLPASTTPLAGTEVLPIVQSGATKQVSVANLTAGRALSATELTLSTGNLIIGTSGKGIDFSATSGAGTSELLSDYEEGLHTATATPNAGGSITLADNELQYTKIGRLVTVSGILTVASVSTPLGRIDISLPFTCANLTESAGFSCGAVQMPGAISNMNAFVIIIQEGEALCRLYLGNATSYVATSANEVTTATSIRLNFSYVAA